MKRWLTFLRNHREVIAAMDFFHRPNAHLRYSVLFLGFSATIRMRFARTDASWTSEGHASRSAHRNSLCAIGAALGGAMTARSPPESAASSARPPPENGHDYF